MDSTSISLLNRLREPRPEEAWRRFVDLYAPLIFYWGRQQGLNPTDAADLVQDVLATLVVELPRFEYDPDRRFRGWLRTITVNKASDLSRRNARRPRADTEQLMRISTATSDADLFEEVEYRALLVRRAMELLRAEYHNHTWQSAWLQLVEGRRAVDVAADLNLSLNSVYLAKSRLLSRLREELAGLLD